MPIYEYECRTCSHSFELLVRDATPPRCPTCKGHELARLPSLCAVSSEQTQATNRQASEKHMAKARRDHAHAEHERYHGHDH